ncbi:Hypothetical protein LUCI_4144 [Lucifera butyrica]|uniref:RNA polymerase sigma-70 region 4 domain-containing protein n=1 Tax=Lucifera butyrica TaxID=1351585 RepID=A0A498RBM7_9FIRM|nr:hypothetical protein [Lucifera butyrica]VBB08861.1 Hypothetical protein LUCI_4144 [Lucifera butyrica]
MHWEINLLKHLVNKELPRLNSNSLHLFGEKYGINYFGEINRQVLKKCYFDDVILCRNVLHQLAFYGVIFQGGLYNYSILENEDDSLYLWKDIAEEGIFNPPIPQHVLRKMKEYGIFFEKDAIGIPLLSLLKYQEDFPFQEVLSDYGFELLTYRQFLNKLGYYYPDVRNTSNSANASAKFDSSPGNPLRPAGCDAWGQVLDELETLLQGPDGKSTSEICESLRRLREKIEISQKNKDVEELIDTAGKIRLDGKILEIPFGLLGKPIFLEKFSGCQQVPQKLTMLGYTKWNELPFDLDEELKKIAGIGPKTIKKFVAKVGEIFADARQTEANDLAVKISLGKLQVCLPQEKVAGSLTQLKSHQFDVTPALDILSAIGIRSFNDLPYKLENLGQWLPKFQIFEIFDSLCSVFSKNLTLESRIQFTISSILDIVNSRKCKGIQRVLSILETKFHMLQDKKNPSLKDIGNVFGISGERVRQILARFWRRELLRPDCFMESIIDDINRLGGLIPLEHFGTGFKDLSRFEQFIAGEVFNVFGLTVVVQDSLLTTLTKGDYGTVLNELETELQSVDVLPINKAVVEEIVKSLMSRRGFHPSGQKAILHITFRDMLMPGDNGFVLKKLSKSEKILYVLKEYSQGLAIYKEFDSFFARLDKLFPGDFHKDDRYIYSSVASSEKALLWGWGIYIHRDNIQINKKDLEKVVTWINRQFAGGLEKMSVSTAFNEFRNFMDEKSIPNEHALYSCLRYFYGQNFFMPKSPYLYPRFERKQNMEKLETFIKDRQHAIN